MNDPVQPLAAELLASYLAGEISSEKAMAVESWIDSSPGNRQYFEEFRKIWIETGKLNPPPLFVNVDQAWNSLSERIESFEKTETPSAISANQFIFTRGLILRIAAIIMIPLLSVFGYLIVRNTLNKGKTNELFATSATVKKDLPDGSVVTLNAHSGLSYPEKFSGKLREVTMHGEIFFEISPDKEKPFKVFADNAEIIVTGTTFNVRSYADEPEIVVYVESGRVIMKVGNRDSGQTSSVTLDAGDKGIYHKTTQILEKTTLTVANDLFWLNNTLNFIRTPLPEVISVIEKNYKVTIELKQEHFKNLRLSSSFTNQPVDSILQIIAGTFDMKLNKNGTHYILDNNDR